MNFLSPNRPSCSGAGKQGGTPLSFTAPTVTLHCPSCRRPCSPCCVMAVWSPATRSSTSTSPDSRCCCCCCRRHCCRRCTCPHLGQQACNGGPNPLQQASVEAAVLGLVKPLVQGQPLRGQGRHMQGHGWWACLGWRAGSAAPGQHAPLRTSSKDASKQTRKSFARTVGICPVLCCGRNSLAACAP